MSDIQATIFNTDTKDHFIASAYMLGDLVHEIGKDNIQVNCFYHTSKTKIKDGNKEKEVEASNIDLCKEIIVNHFKIPEKNVFFKDKGVTMFDKLESTVKEALNSKAEVHVINMPTTQQDKNENPTEINSMLQGEALNLCYLLVNQHVDNMKLKDGKEIQNQRDRFRISPMWRFQYMDVQYLKDNLHRHGLSQFFEEKKE